MEYPGNAFHTFLNLDSVIYVTDNGTATSLPVFIKISFFYKLCYKDEHSFYGVFLCDVSE